MSKRGGRHSRSAARKAAATRRAAAAKVRAAKRAAAAKAAADRKTPAAKEKAAREEAKRTTSDGYVAPKQLPHTPGREAWKRKGDLASLTGQCKSKCRGRCWLGGKGQPQVDAQCMLSEASFGNIERNLMDFRNAKGRPTWTLWNSQRTAILGEVQCPCRDDTGMPLSKREALRSIAGQVAAMGIRFSCLKDTWKADWNIRVVVSAAVMLSCWERKCAAEEQGRPMPPAMIDLKEQLLAKLGEISAKAQEHVTAPGMTGLRDSLVAKLREASAKVQGQATASEMTGLREQLVGELDAISDKVTGMLGLREQLVAKLDEISAKAREHVTAPGMTGLRDKLVAKLGEISAKVQDGAVGSEMTGLREQLERGLDAISAKVTGMLGLREQLVAKLDEISALAQPDAPTMDTDLDLQDMLAGPINACLKAASACFTAVGFCACNIRSVPAYSCPVHPMCLACNVLYRKRDRSPPVGKIMGQSIAISKWRFATQTQDNIAVDCFSLDADVSKKEMDHFFLDADVSTKEMDRFWTASPWMPMSPTVNPTEPSAC